MNLREVLEQQAPDEVVYLDYLTLDPQPDAIVLTAKSPVFHSWMKGLAKGKVMKSDKWAGEYYKVNLDNIALPNNALGWEWNNVGGALSKLGPNGTLINLSWLRSCQLDEGVEIQFSQVSAWTDIEDYMNVAADVLKNLYLQQIRRSVLKLRLSEVFDE
jgi:hypothetical protein